ncbi:hypothetical protein AMS68_004604 [Peltaster fructicola]|uniref:Septation initiation network scaffold protein cdc11 n=1 Tax=Peltaster fructicola TaxID=286661 RepID=A0A6H0XWE8_9PEZI|nr:hypothetical protein AMS68_004604 [Peltaster fructicola]
MKKTRSPLALLHHNENSSVRRTEAPASDDPQGTVQLRSKSASPAKKTASLEWRKRLLHGKVAYGDQTDLFGPSGLDNIFAANGSRQASSRHDTDKSLGWIPRTDATMPSSPPPWPMKSLQDQRDELSASKSRSSPRSELPSQAKNKASAIDIVTRSSSTRSNPFDLEVSAPDLEVSHNAELGNSTIYEQGANRTTGVLTELEQEDFSPVFISKHTTLSGKIDYAAIDSEALEEIKRHGKIHEAGTEARELDKPKDTRDDIYQAEESVFTDGPESKSQIHIPQDLSLSENLPTGTPEPLGRFVQVQRGGYSVIGSFRHRPLSMEPSAVSVNPESDEILPPVSTPPLTAAGSSTTAVMSKREAPSTPLKLFAAHDTFTSNRLLHRMTELDDEVVHAARSTQAITRDTTPAHVHRHVSFGSGKLNGTPFDTIAAGTSLGSSPASDVQVPGSKIPHTFRQDSTKLRTSSQTSQVLSKRPRGSGNDHIDQGTLPKVQSENKRPPASPLKNSTPKRRRTLHASELASMAHAPKANIMQQVVDASNTRAHQATSTCTEDSLNPPEHAIDAMDATIREAADDFLDHEDPSIVEVVLEQIEQSLTDSDPATIRERAEVVAGELAKYTLKVHKADDRDSDGMRKPSVTTADFFREAECVMEYIRARAAKTKSLLASVEEAEQEDTGPDESLLMPKGPAQTAHHMRVSREPSWEDRPRSGWREPEQQRLQRSAVSMNRVASQLRRWQEPDVIEEQDVFLVDSGPLQQDIGEQSSEVVYDQHAQIRITGPSAEYQQRKQDGTDSRPSSQRSAQSSNENTRRTDNVGTLAPSAVAHLIGSEVGGMTFDKDKQQWVRTRTAEHKPDNGYLNVHESHITSEDDPFREISDLVVDENSEKRRISSPARMLDTSGRPDQLLPLPAIGGLPLSTRPASFHGSRSPERQLSISDTVLRPQYDAPLQSSVEQSSAKSTLMHSGSTLTTAERVNRVFDDAEAAIKAEQEFVVAQRATHGTTTSAPDVDYLSRCRDEEDEKLSVHSQHTSSAQPQSVARKPALYDEQTIPVLPRPWDNHSMIEQSEVSFVAPLPGDRMISVSLSVSKPVIPLERVGHVVDLASSPLRHMSTMMLSDLPDFTVHDDDAERPSEAAMVKRFARYAEAERRDRFALATKELTKALTDRHPDEPYWEELQQLDLRDQSLTTLHGLDTYCNGIRALNVSANKLTHLEGVPRSVRKLAARANALSSLTQFSHLPNLQYVDITRNGLEDLAALQGCIHLRELKADENHIEDINALSNSGLLKLRCRRNDIIRLDWVEGDFQSLTELDLCSNKVRSIHGLEHLTSLETLKLSDNELQDGALDQLNLPSLKRLVLRNCGLERLDVSGTPNLEILDVDDNSLSVIEGLENLARLQVLSMRRQRLAEGVCVDVFGKAMEAHTVNLSGNVLPQLHITPACLSLRHLELSAVGLSQLPESFGLSMSNLRTLNLNSNNIKDLRPLLHMNALQKLQLAGNRLCRLRKNAAVLVHLPALSTIDLRDNPISQGFYTSMTSAMHKTTTDLIQCLPIDEQDDDAVYEQTQAVQYGMRPQDPEEDARHLLRLDEDTKLRRRVYEMLLAHSCKKVDEIDGLIFRKNKTLQKDHIWEKLLALGVVRKSPT